MINKRNRLYKWLALWIVILMIIGSACVEANSSKPKKKRPSAQKDAGKDSAENLAPLATVSGPGIEPRAAVSLVTGCVCSIIVFT